MMNSTTILKNTRYAGEGIEFNLLNSSTLYQDNLKLIQNSYEGRNRNMLTTYMNSLDQLEFNSENSKLAEKFEEVITLNIYNGQEKVNLISKVLFDANIEIQGIRFNQDNTAIEIGLLESADRYKSLLILESIGI